MESFLETQRRLVKTQEGRIQSDKAAMMRFVEEYYGSAEKVIGQVKEQIEEVENKLEKL